MTLTSTALKSFISKNFAYIAVNNLWAKKRQTGRDVAQKSKQQNSNNFGLMNTF